MKKINEKMTERVSGLKRKRVLRQGERMGKKKRLMTALIGSDQALRPIGARKTVKRT